MKYVRFYSTLNLQRFAEGEGEGTGEGDGTQSTETTTTSTNNDESESSSTETTPFKAFASEKELQAYTDKLIQSAIKTHDEKKAGEAQQQKDYEQMNDLEKANYDKDQLQKQLAESQTHAKVVENRAKITERLGSDDLPTGLISVFGADTLADDDSLEEAYKNVSKVFSESLQKAIDKRIAGSGVGAPGGVNTASKTEGATVAEQFNKEQQPVKSNLWATK
ncbi:DUF4355 domain-containing protein [Liquorilactobacillus mali]|uniref:capsid assembly scaffolding protein Gp46 family protein n=1 Tax=Liquorilactobacillus mali TaxID=1618 RepID=UPI00264AF706|nr:DUF4355 domain-containing protein [Liquorilactobacillus mali]MDN7144437.1 DUF4355 domain-containing protein [Liquorilactobacillus mali]